MQDYISTVSQPKITKNIGNARVENIIKTFSWIFDYSLGERKCMASRIVMNLI